MKMNYEEFSQIIAGAQGSDVDFGSRDSNLVPSSHRISETEKILGQKLPESYVWFLQNYGGGEVFGDEIAVIPPEYCENNYLDIAARTLSYRKNLSINDSEICFLSTDFGENFLFDAASFESEYRVVRKTGSERKVVAKNFLEFIIKMVREEIS